MKSSGSAPNMRTYSSSNTCKMRTLYTAVGWTREDNTHAGMIISEPNFSTKQGRHKNGGLGTISSIPFHRRIIAWRLHPPHGLLVIVVYPRTTTQRPISRVRDPPIGPSSSCKKLAGRNRLCRRVYAQFDASRRVKKLLKSFRDVRTVARMGGGGVPAIWPNG